MSPNGFSPQRAILAIHRMNLESVTSYRATDLQRRRANCVTMQSAGRRGLPLGVLFEVGVDELVHQVGHFGSCVGDAKGAGTDDEERVRLPRGA